MAKLLAQWQEEERLRKEREEEERRIREKQERESFQKELSQEWNDKFESVCGTLRSSNLNVERELELLKRQIEDLKISQKQGVHPGASTSTQTTGNDALLARMLQEHEDMKTSLERASGACKKVESLEAELRTLKQSHEEAVTEAEAWKKEALKSRNKRSRLTISPSSELKMPPATTPANKDRPVTDPSQLQQLHNLEVDALKGEAETQREVERENARLKEELGRRGVEKRTPMSTFRERLDEVETVAGGSGLKTNKKKKVVGGNDDTKENVRDAFLREARKEFRNLKNDDVMEICLKEGIKYTTLTETVSEIIAKRADRAFGKRVVVQEISDDIAGGAQVDSRNDGRDSVTS
ncbi:hypothetical protein CBR_g50325 [Chara braunii]|uniref:Uncharacterized protein n=1 Tax=Chara braunii TaxID=69332 RepID=A0A388K5R1_CHABU|nr:hypothetical protein CBR_g50325 [Chara braunii]|eukprot:GBG65283.1 hypothetical protein CBR_g50325 [Chara braunii]